MQLQELLLCSVSLQILLLYHLLAISSCFLFQCDYKVKLTCTPQSEHEVLHDIHLPLL